MKNLGKVVINKNDPSTFNIFIGVLGEEIFYSQKPFDGANAYVVVQYSGVYAGTQQQQKQFVIDRIESYLFKNGYLDEIESAVLFKDCDYIPSKKLIEAVK